jgi:hypothetical protein
MIYTLSLRVKIAGGYSANRCILKLRNENDEPFHSKENDTLVVEFDSFAHA